MPMPIPPRERKGASCTFVGVGCSSPVLRSSFWGGAGASRAIVMDTMQRYQYRFRKYKEH